VCSPDHGGLCSFCVLQVIQPVFNHMAEQIALMGDAGEAPALRLCYDDFNESTCMPEVCFCMLTLLTDSALLGQPKSVALLHSNLAVMPTRVSGLPHC
jgi:hypothetical protein